MLCTISVKRLQPIRQLPQVLSYAKSFFLSTYAPFPKDGIKIDTSGLIDFGPKWPSPLELKDIEAKKEPLTPLVKHLRSIIQIRGPISVHDYMSQALHHHEYGYYQHKSEKIGEKGDFITSPEISQLFGELIGIWCIATWEEMGRPSAINLVELGPGTGTLMHDILKTIEKFPRFKSALTVQMVELSETMRGLQKKSLGCIATTGENQSSEDGRVDPVFSGRTECGVSIHWHNYLHHVPPGPAMYVGQEILDAFPVYQFARVSEKWKEILVDVDFSEDSKYHFRFVRSSAPSPACKVFFDPSLKHVANKPLSHIPHTNENTSALTAPETEHALYSENSDFLEICPLAFSTVEEISRNVLAHKGAALLIDYGENFPQGDTLRGFKKHVATHVLSEPGMVDISADVNFKACAQVAKEQGAAVWGPVTQGEFLGRMGILQRVEQIIDSPEVTDADANKIFESTKRILEGEMGNKFKVISVTHPSVRTPGFGS
mmetsp:Transcript_8648/g.12918  ORF Transcript_8648/g.12918 Transcript_8648/m.12918 type:complete len:489 (-) Transcript_8648:63-1529(-)